MIRALPLRPLHGALALAALAFLMASPAGGSDSPAKPETLAAARGEAAPAGPEHEQRIAALRAELARDQARLLQRLANTGDDEATALSLDPELRAIAARMPALQRELRALLETTPEPAGADAPAAP